MAIPLVTCGLGLSNEASASPYVHRTDASVKKSSTQEDIMCWSAENRWGEQPDTSPSTT